MNAAFALVLGAGLTAEGAGQIFVASASTGKIGQYTTSGVAINATLISGLTGPEGIVVDGDGYIYVADTDAGRIGKYTITGEVVNRSLIAEVGSPWALALDGKGHLYVANYGGRCIGKYTTTGTVINASLISGLDYLTGVAVNDDGDLFAGNYGLAFDWIGSIGKYRTSGETINAALIPGLKWNWGLACDQEGDLFVAQNLPAGRITEYRSSGQVVNTFATGLAAPTAIALDGSGGLFVADDWYGVIGEYTTAGATVNAALIAGLQHPRGVAVGVPPGPVQIADGDRTAYAGSTTELTADCTGTEPLTRIWLLSATNLIGEVRSSHFLELTNLSSGDSGAYTVVISNVFGATTSAPVMLSVIPPVRHRVVPGLKLSGETGSKMNVDCASTLSPAPDWSGLDSVSLASSSQFYFDLTQTLPTQRFYRVWQMGAPVVVPTLNLHIVPAITLTGNIGDSLRLDYINQFGPTNAWVTLDTVTLTNMSQLYFDVSAIGQPPRLWRIVPGP